MKMLLFMMLFLISRVDASECANGEIVIASCTLQDRGEAVFCLNKPSGDLYYSFKKNNDLELKVTFTKVNKLKRWVDLGTYTTYFGFINEGFGYSLGVPEEKPNARAFLNIKQNGKLISLRDCESNSFGEKEIKSDKIEEVNDLDVRNNGFRFPY